MLIEEGSKVAQLYQEVLRSDYNNLFTLITVTKSVWFLASRRKMYNFKLKAKELTDFSASAIVKFIHLEILSSTDENRAVGMQTCTIDLRGNGVFSNLGQSGIKKED